MGNYQIVNIFDLFKQFWQEHSHISISEQVKKYEAIFQKLYPELWQMQVDCYAEDDFDWKEAALKHVFPINIFIILLIFSNFFNFLRTFSSFLSLIGFSPLYSLIE